MTAIHSPALYTSLYGYKLCMRMNLNGVDSGVGKYVALFVHMMQGDYDTILEWPFTGRIALSILDQSDASEFRHDISQCFGVNLDPPNVAFQRPLTKRNIKGYGFVDFAPIAQIDRGQYAKGNTILVRIQIYCHRLCWRYIEDITWLRWDTKFPFECCFFNSRREISYLQATMDYVAIATVIFSHVKISSFRAKAHLVFHWGLYNKYRY